MRDVGWDCSPGLSLVQRYILLNLRFINANQPSEGKKSMKVLVLWQDWHTEVKMLPGVHWWDCFLSLHFICSKTAGLHWQPWLNTSPDLLTCKSKPVESQAPLQVIFVGFFWGSVAKRVGAAFCSKSPLQTKRWHPQKNDELFSCNSHASCCHSVVLFKKEGPIDNIADRTTQSLVDLRCLGGK